MQCFRGIACYIKLMGSVSSLVINGFTCTFNLDAYLFINQFSCRITKSKTKYNQKKYNKVSLLAASRELEDESSDESETEMDIDVYAMPGIQKAKHDLMMKSEVCFIER